MARSEPPVLPSLTPRPSRTREALDLIRDAILSGALAPGSRHSVGTLAESLGVSRTPVREALIQLSTNGMVRFERNRGVRILATTVQEIHDIFEIRLLLEVPTARKAVERITPERRAELRALVARMEAAASEGQEAELWQADRAFHRQLLSASGNNRLAEYVDSLRDMVLTKGVTTAGKSRSLSEIAAEHRRILACVEKGDADGAAQQLEEHLTRTATLLVKQESGRDGPE